MFTFGRDHERECARRSVRDPSQWVLVAALIDSVHGFLEDRTTEEPVRSAIRAAFVEGGAGVWEQAGSWLRKLCGDFPVFRPLWREFAAHSRAEVRFRAAAFIDDLDQSVASDLHARLAIDRSARVREMADDRWALRRDRTDA